MLRLVLLASLAAAAALPTGRAVAQKGKPPGAEDIGESLAVVEELGLRPVAGLPKKLAEEYRPDLVTPGDVRKDPEKYPLRNAVLDAVDVLRRDRELPRITSFPERELNPRGKMAIVKRQEEVAKVSAALREVLGRLDAAADRRQTEPSKRWQAHCDYIRALVKQRIASIEEYNLMLGRIRTEQLPKLEKPDQNGWRLATAEKMGSAKDVRELADEARTGFAEVAKQYPGTTWAALADRDAKAPLGLTWQATDLPQPKRKK